MFVFTLTDYIMQHNKKHKFCFSELKLLSKFLLCDSRRKKRVRIQIDAGCGMKETSFFLYLFIYSKKPGTFKYRIFLRYRNRTVLQPIYIRL
jgi:hypothetical protein